CAGTESTPMMRVLTALVATDYRDAIRIRAGRSAVSPNAGGTALPRPRPGHARTAIACGWPLAKQQSFKLKRLFNASATRKTSAREWPQGLDLRTCRPEFPRPPDPLLTTPPGATVLKPPRQTSTCSAVRARTWHCPSADRRRLTCISAGERTPEPDH